MYIFIVSHNEEEIIPIELLGLNYLKVFEKELEKISSLCLCLESGSELLYDVDRLIFSAEKGDNFEYGT